MIEQQILGLQIAMDDVDTPHTTHNIHMAHVTQNTTHHNTHAKDNIPISNKLSKAEISELDVAHVIEQQILGLQIAMNDVRLVKIGHGQNDFGRVELRGSVAQTRRSKGPVY